LRCRGVVAGCGNAATGASRRSTPCAGTARLRLTFTAQHPDDQIERLADIVREKILAT